MSSYNAQALTCILRVRLPVIVLAYFLGVPQAFLLQLIQVAPQLGLADPVSAAIANPAGLPPPVRRNRTLCAAAKGLGPVTPEVRLTDVPVVWPGSAELIRF